MNAVQPTEIEAISRIAVTSRPWSLLKKRILILGSGQLAIDVVQTVRSRRMTFYEVVGFVDSAPERVGNGLAQSEIIGTYDQIFEIVERARIQTIAVCIDDCRANLPVQTLLDCKTMGIEVVDGHDFYEKEMGRLSIDQLRPSALIFSSGFRRRSSVMIFKRVFDVIIAALGLLLLLPVLMLIGLLIKLDSPGPVLYRQMRVGLKGQPYIILKFRSMFKDA